MPRFKAPIAVRIDTASLESTARRLADLDRRAARKAVRAGINEVSKLVLGEAKALVPRRTGQLKKSLGRKVKSYKGGAVILGIVKPRGKVRVKGQWVAKFRKEFKGLGRWDKATRSFGSGTVDPVKYAHLVEYGRVAVVPKKKKVLAGQGVVWGARVRATAPRPFMRPAWERYRAASPGIIRRYLDKAIKDYWAKGKLNARGNRR
jgi:hypothetical protein